MGLKDTLLSLLGQATDGAKDFAGKAADVTRGVAGKAADKAKAGGRIAKLTVDIAREKDEMKKTFLEIGKLYYDTHKDNPDGFFTQLCEEIALAEKNVAEKEAELAELKEAFNSKAEPDVEVEFEEVVGQAEAEAEGCCDEAAEAVKSCCDEAGQAAEDAKCCCEEAAEKVAEEAKCCCEDTAEAVDKAADAVKDAAEKAVDAVAETAEEVVDAVKDCCCKKDD